MKKLALKLDELKIESFSTRDAQPEAVGTVHGNLQNSNGCIQTLNTCYACNPGGNEPTFRLSCPYCTGPYCGSDDPSQANCYTGAGGTC